LEIKVLKPEDYHLLKQAPDEFVPDPAMSVAVVAMDGERLVGKVLLVILPHVEGPWIHPDYRGGLIAKRGHDLLAEAVKEKWNITKLFAFGATEEIEGYLKRLGYTKEPLSVWSKEI
jgi:hypothetical protein